MNLQLSKQYPFNFVAFAFEVLEKPIDERALAKFDAYEVDVFLHERGMAEKNALEYLFVDEDKRDKLSPEQKEDYKRYLSNAVVDFEREFLRGRFSLVSLFDFDNLAISWAEVEKLANKIDRNQDATRAVRCLNDIRTRLAGFLMITNCYRARNPLASDPEIEKISVLDFRMDSNGRQILRDNCLNTVGDLMRVTADYLLNISGFGEKRLQAVRDNLAEYGVHLLGE